MRTSASLAASTMSGQAIMFSGSLWPVECIYQNFMISDSNLQNKTHKVKMFVSGDIYSPYL